MKALMLRRLFSRFGACSPVDVCSKVNFCSPARGQAAYRNETSWCDRCWGAQLSRYANSPRPMPGRFLREPVFRLYSRPKSGNSLPHNVQNLAVPGTLASKGWLLAFASKNTVIREIAPLGHGHGVNGAQIAPLCLGFLSLSASPY
jgi:hypothetical protein